MHTIIKTISVLIIVFVSFICGYVIGNSNVKEKNPDIAFTPKPAISTIVPTPTKQEEEKSTKNDLVMADIPNPTNEELETLRKNYRENKTVENGELLTSSMLNRAMHLIENEDFENFILLAREASDIEMEIFSSHGERAQFATTYTELRDFWMRHNIELFIKYIKNPKLTTKEKEIYLRDMSEYYLENYPSEVDGTYTKNP